MQRRPTDFLFEPYVFPVSKSNNNHKSKPNNQNLLQHQQNRPASSEYQFSNDDNEYENDNEEENSQISNNNKPSKSKNTNIQNPNQQFSASQRQSLKNAFRYICRLIFKQALSYPTKLSSLASVYSLKTNNNKYGEDPPLYLFQCAQQISGERYFSKHLTTECTKQQRQVICKFMLWFLEVKYLRYIHQHGKGKRRQMKKSLYVKFKNQVMIPYLYGMLLGCQ